MTVIAEVFRQVMERGELRPEDPSIVAQYFGALISAENQHRWFCRDVPPITKAQIRCTAERAVAGFLRAYTLDGLYPQTSGRSI